LKTGGSGLVLAASSGILAAPSQKFLKETPEQRRRRRFVNNVLVTHEGREVRFYDDLLKDKTVLINFMYTLCQGEGFCPTMALNLMKLQPLLGDRLGKDVFIYSITLDPEHDTPKVLDSYARHFRAIPGGWLFLTGKIPDVAAVRQSLGFKWADRNLDRDKQEHIGIIKFGIENLERWGACPALTKPEAIASYIDWLDPANGMRPRG
jgi:protein SCO1/2